MLSWIKYYIRRYFGFSRGQTYGVVVLLFLLGVALVLPRIIHYYDIHEQKKEALRNVSVLDVLVEELKLAKVESKVYIDRGDSEKRVWLDINVACENDLKKLYGIGPVRASRIVAYRNNLGGFVDTKQYGEVYKLPADVVDRLQKHFFVQPHFIPKKINLNKASLQILSSHPYLTYNQAKVILAYKAQHGNFCSIKDLKKVKCLDETTLKKLLPYLFI